MSCGSVALSVCQKIGRLPLSPPRSRARGPNGRSGAGAGGIRQEVRGGFGCIRRIEMEACGLEHRRCAS